MDAKSNKIAAIPHLLRLLQLKGCLVTLDAAGCPTKIASQIVEQGADDILAVKNKQPGLAKVVRESFESSDEHEETKDLVDFCETQDVGYGKTEIRRCTVLKTDSSHPLPPAWESLAAMIRIESERSEGGTTTPHTRYFISSTWMKAKDFLEAIRQHWSIENHLHGVLIPSRI